MAVQSIPQDLRDKLDRYAKAQRQMAQSQRRLAAFAEEIRDALDRFYATGGVLEPGGQKNDWDERQDARPRP